MPTLVLASTSRYRRELLGRLGLPFECRAPEVDESQRHGESPEALAARLGAAKAERCAAPGLVVIGADQVPSLDGRALGKPGSHAAALQQLTACQGKTVTFYTAVTIVDGSSGRRAATVDRTDVEFARLPAAALERYLAIEQPYDCAGGFKAEGLGIVLFERIVSQDPTGLLGLPLIWVARTLREAGLDPLDPAAPPRP